MEELQEIASPQKMGSVVVSKIVQGFPVHGPMVSNAKGSEVCRNSSRGTSFRPKNWSFVARKWQEKEDFFEYGVTQTRCIFNRFR